MTQQHGKTKTVTFLWTYADRVCKDCGQTWYKDEKCLKALQEVQNHYKPILYKVDWSYGVDENGIFPSTAYDNL